VFDDSAGCHRVDALGHSTLGSQTLKNKVFHVN